MKICKGPRMPWFVGLLMTLLASSISQSASAEPENKTDLCGPAPQKRIVCYYQAENNEFQIEDLNPCLCTHFVYGSIGLDDDMVFTDRNEDDFKAMKALKLKNPQLKNLLSIKDASVLGSTPLRTFAASSNTTDQLGKKLRRLARDTLTNGIDIEWTYDHLNATNATEEKAVLTNFLKRLRSALDNVTLTLTTSKNPSALINGYDFRNISRHVDFINVPAFQFDLCNKSIAQHHGRLHGVADMENMDSMVDLLLTMGTNKEKIVVAIPTFGVSYKLLNENETKPGSAVEYGKPMVMTHSEICVARQSGNWTLVREKDQTAPYVYKGKTWIGFDDEISFRLKSKYVLLRNLGGVMVWTANQDDYRGLCGNGQFPLLRSIKDILSGSKSRSQTNGTDELEEYLDYSESRVVEVYDQAGNIFKTDYASTDTIEGMSCTRQGYYRHPADCTRFYRCVKFNQLNDAFSIFQYDCPSGLVFDERHEVCNWPSWSPPCDGSGEIMPRSISDFYCPDLGYYRDPENCRIFFYCNDVFGNGTLSAYEFKCPYNLAFDEERLVCDWPLLVSGCAEKVGLIGAHNGFASGVIQHGGLFGGSGLVHSLRENQARRGYRIKPLNGYQGYADYDTYDGGDGVTGSNLYGEARVHAPSTLVGQDGLGLVGVQGASRATLQLNKGVVGSQHDAKLLVDNRPGFVAESHTLEGGAGGYALYGEARVAGKSDGSSGTYVVNDGVQGYVGQVRSAGYVVNGGSVSTQGHAGVSLVQNQGNAKYATQGGDGLGFIQSHGQGATLIQNQGAQGYIQGVGEGINLHGVERQDQGHVFAGGLSQGYGITGGLSQGHGITGGLSQGHGITGGLSQGHGITGGLSQGHGITGGLSQGHGITGGLSQGQVFTGGLSQGHGITGGLSQGHGITGGLSQGHGITGGLSQGHGITGVLSQGHGITGGLSQGHGLTGLSQGQPGYVQGVGDGINLHGVQGQDTGHGYTGGLSQGHPGYVAVQYGTGSAGPNGNLQTGRVNYGPARIANIGGTLLTEPLQYQPGVGLTQPRGLRGDEGVFQGLPPPPISPIGRPRPLGRTGTSYSHFIKLVPQTKGIPDPPGVTGTSTGPIRLTGPLANRLQNAVAALQANGRANGGVPLAPVAIGQPGLTITGGTTLYGQGRVRTGQNVVVQPQVETVRFDDDHDLRINLQQGLGKSIDQQKIQLSPLEIEQEVRTVHHNVPVVQIDQQKSIHKIPVHTVEQEVKSIHQPLEPQFEIEQEVKSIHKPVIQTTYVEQQPQVVHQPQIVHQPQVVKQVGPVGVKSTSYQNTYIQKQPVVHQVQVQQPQVVQVKQPVGVKSTAYQTTFVQEQPQIVQQPQVVHDIRPQLVQPAYIEQPQVIQQVKQPVGVKSTAYQTTYIQEQPQIVHQPQVVQEIRQPLKTTTYVQQPQVVQEIRPVQVKQPVGVKSTYIQEQPQIVHQPQVFQQIRPVQPLKTTTYVQQPQVVQEFRPIVKQPVGVKSTAYQTTYIQEQPQIVHQPQVVQEVRPIQVKQPVGIKSTAYQEIQTPHKSIHLQDQDINLFQPYVPTMALDMGLRQEYYLRQQVHPAYGRINFGEPAFPRAPIQPVTVQSRPVLQPVIQPRPPKGDEGSAPKPRVTINFRELPIAVKSIHSLPQPAPFPPNIAPNTYYSSIHSTINLPGPRQPERANYGEVRQLPELYQEIQPCITCSTKPITIQQFQARPQPIPVIQKSPDIYVQQEPVKSVQYVSGGQTEPAFGVKIPTQSIAPITEVKSIQQPIVQHVKSIHKAPEPISQVYLQKQHVQQPRPILIEQEQPIRYVPPRPPTQFVQVQPKPKVYTEVKTIQQPVVQIHRPQPRPVIVEQPIVQVQQPQVVQVKQIHRPQPRPVIVQQPIVQVQQPQVVQVKQIHRPQPRPVIVQQQIVQVQQPQVVQVKQIHRPQPRPVIVQQPQVVQVKEIPRPVVQQYQPVVHVQQPQVVQVKQIQRPEPIVVHSPPPKSVVQVHIQTPPRPEVVIHRQPQPVQIIQPVVKSIQQPVQQIKVRLPPPPPPVQVLAPAPQPIQPIQQIRVEYDQPKLQVYEPIRIRPAPVPVQTFEVRPAPVPVKSITPVKSIQARPLPPQPLEIALAVQPLPPVQVPVKTVEVRRPPQKIVPIFQEPIRLQPRPKQILIQDPPVRIEVRQPRPKPVQIVQEPIRIQELPPPPVVKVRQPPRPKQIQIVQEPIRIQELPPPPVVKVRQPPRPKQVQIVQEPIRIQEIPPPPVRVEVRQPPRPKPVQIVQEPIRIQELPPPPVKVEVRQPPRPKQVQIVQEPIRIRELPPPPVIRQPPRPKTVQVVKKLPPPPVKIVLPPPPVEVTQVKQPIEIRYPAPPPRVNIELQRIPKVKEQVIEIQKPVRPPPQVIKTVVKIPDPPRVVQKVKIVEDPPVTPPPSGRVNYAPVRERRPTPPAPLAAGPQEPRQRGRERPQSTSYIFRQPPSGPKSAYSQAPPETPTTPAGEFDNVPAPAPNVESGPASGSRLFSEGRTRRPNASNNPEGRPQKIVVKYGQRLGDTEASMVDGKMVVKVQVPRGSLTQGDTGRVVRPTSDNRDVVVKTIRTEKVQVPVVGVKTVRTEQIKAPVVGVKTSGRLTEAGNLKTVRTRKRQRNRPRVDPELIKSQLLPAEHRGQDEGVAIIEQQRGFSNNQDGRKTIEQQRVNLDNIQDGRKSIQQQRDNLDNLQDGRKSIQQQRDNLDNLQDGRKSIQQRDNLDNLQDGRKSIQQQRDNLDNLQDGRKSIQQQRENLDNLQDGRKSIQQQRENLDNLQDGRKSIQQQRDNIQDGRKSIQQRDNLDNLQDGRKSIQQQRDNLDNLQDGRKSIQQQRDNIQDGRKSIQQQRDNLDNLQDGQKSISQGKSIQITRTDVDTGYQSIQRAKSNTDQGKSIQTENLEEVKSAQGQGKTNTRSRQRGQGHNRPNQGIKTTGSDRDGQGRDRPSRRRQEHQTRQPLDSRSLFDKSSNNEQLQDKEKSESQQPLIDQGPDNVKPKSRKRGRSKKGKDSLPDTACTRPGLFRHPDNCNKFYECFYDKWLNKFTLHMFECPIRLAFDDQVFGCTELAAKTPCKTKKTSTSDDKA